MRLRIPFNPSQADRLVADATPESPCPVAALHGSNASSAASS